MLSASPTCFCFTGRPVLALPGLSLGLPSDMWAWHAMGRTGCCWVMFKPEVYGIGSQCGDILTKEIWGLVGKILSLPPPWTDWVEILPRRLYHEVEQWVAQSSSELGDWHLLAWTPSLLPWITPLSLTVSLGVAHPNMLNFFVLASTFWRSQAKTCFSRENTTV